MTCVIGYLDENQMYMGADSAGCTDHQTFQRKDPKVFRLNGALIAFTHSFRMGQLLNFNLEFPDKPTKEDPYQWMVKRFIPAVRKCFADGGYLKKESDRESGGFFMVAAHGRLFGVESDFQVGEYYLPYLAMGCGEEYAMGALAAMEGEKGLSPRVRIRRALEIASRFSGYVCPPFRVISAKGE